MRFSTAAVLIAVLLKCSIISGLQKRQQRDIVVQSLFGSDAEGWLLTHSSFEDQRQPEHVRAMIRGSDPWGATDAWWFSAPRTFVETLRSIQAESYGAEMCFTFSQPESPRLPAKPLANLPDVMLESHCGRRVGIFGLLTAGAKVPKERCVRFEHEQGWIVGQPSANGKLQWLQKASVEKLGGVLWHLKGIHVRGSHFEMQETSQLSRVRVYARPASPSRGDGSHSSAHSPILGCCHGGRLSLRCRSAASSPHGEFDQHGSSRRHKQDNSSTGLGADVCRLVQHGAPVGECRSGSVSGRDEDGRAWPVDGSLPCAGDLDAVPVVLDVFPRSARRRGGSLITVTGENFGITGTRPIMRIAGRVGECWHLPTDTPVGNAPPSDESLAAHCRDEILNEDEDKVDCGGADCPRCPWVQLVAHCRDGVLSHDETGVDRGGNDCLPEHCFNGVRGDETGNNCGGSCQPCNPAPVAFGNQHSRLVCEVPSGTAGARWGIQVATRDESGATQSSCPGPATGGECRADDGESISYCHCATCPNTAEGHAWAGWPAPWGEGNHWRAAGFEFGRLETKWATALLPDNVVTDAEIVSLQVDQASGDVYITGTVLGRVIEDSRQATTRQTIPGRTNPFANGNAPEGLGLGLGPDDTAKRGGFVGRLSREGRFRWLTAIQPGALVSATSAAASPSSLSLFPAGDGSVRAVVSGVYEDAVINFFHADPATGSTAGQGGTSDAPVECVQGLGYGAVQSAEQSDELPGGAKRLACTHFALPEPTVPTFNAFLAMYSPDGQVMWVKGGIAASTNTLSTLEGAAQVQVVAGISSTSISGGAFYFAALTGTLQILTNDAQGVFQFGAHPGVWVDGGYPETGQAQSNVNVKFGGSGAGQPRVGFVAHFYMTDFGAWIEWVRLVGPLGTPFQTDLGMTAVAARGWRSGTLLQPSEDEVVVVTGNFNSEASTLGSLPLQDCTYLYSSASSLCATTYNPSSTQEPQIEYNGTADGRNGFVIAYDARGSVLWTRSINGVTQATAVAVFNGYNRAASTRSYSGATAREYVAARRRVSLGPVEEGSFVAVVGNLGKLSQISSPSTASTFGITRQPTWCSRAYTIGAKREPIDHALPCSGVLQPRGEHSDVFVAKYDLRTGEPEWAKRLGLNDAHEEATSVSVGADGAIYVAGAFTAPFVVTPGTAHDVFDMVAAGRPFAVGCALFNPNTAAVTVHLARSLGYWTDPALTAEEAVSIPSNLNQPALPSCLILPHAPLLQTAFVSKIVDGLQPLDPSQSTFEQGLTNSTDIAAAAWALAEHGSCGLPQGEQCLADGVVWARSVGIGQGTFSSQSVSALAIATVDGDAEGEWGVDVDSAVGGSRGSEVDENGVVVAGSFSGFRESQGVTFVVDDNDEGAASGSGGFYVQDRRDVAGFTLHWRE